MKVATHTPEREDLVFSYFPNAKTIKKKKDISLNEYLAIVSEPARKTAAKQLRTLPLEEYKKAKLLQGCITGSCTMDQNGRTLKNIENLNGLAVIDIDKLPNEYESWNALKETIAKDQFTFIVNYSLSGRGLCVFVKIPVENDFKEIYLSFKEYYSMMYDVDIDFLADPTRLRFIPYDPKPFYNSNSETYTHTIQEETQPKENEAFERLAYLSNNDPAAAFNNSGLKGLELINEIFETQGYLIATGKEPIVFEYQRPGGAQKSVVAMNNEDVVKFHVHSPNTGLLKTEYNLYELFKEVSKYEDYEAQKELATAGFGKFTEIEAKSIKANGKESYSLILDYLAKQDIRLNQLTGVIEKSGVPLNDFHISSMLTELSLFSGKNQSKDILLSCLDVIAGNNHYHPFLSFINELQAVKETDLLDYDELDKFIECFTSQTPKKTIRIYFIRWLLGLFDLHLLNRMTKNVLVVSGAQNSCKTSLSKNILFESLKQYGKVTDFNQNKMTDSKIALCSLLVACFDEFEEILSKHRTLAEFKNLTSSYDIFERRPYRRNHEQMFRSSIVMATTNERNILTDSTGNTRFLTIDVKAFDLERYFKIDLLKLWRVIYDLHLLGETSVLDEAERVLQAEQNRDFEAVDPYCEMLEKIFKYDVKGFLTSTDIMRHLEFETRQNLSINKIGQALKKLGFERTSKRVHGSPKYGYSLKARIE